ncbi:DsrE/DsrF/TusD sulfur relay family protein [Aquitalea magnusonii]|uniref:DsrE/DsrF/TusD sulfur relay family protein n=1 Tax=Aquitalea magnusonii TaxID=332411 RepID=UPI000B5C65FB|nr:DsrE family protein [Aquitalea magnusonii]
MQNILLTLNASPYGSERILSALRLTLALASHSQPSRIKLFLISDAVITAQSGQGNTAGPSLGEMLTEAMAHSVAVYVCRSCAEARGLDQTRLLPGVKISTMPELAGWTLEADKVLSF